MKIDIRKATYVLPDSIAQYEEDALEIYITRKQFMSEFEAGVEDCVKLMRNIAEMFTSPHCFYHLPSAEHIVGLYAYLDSHKSAKGVVMQIIENHSGNGEYDLGMYVAK